MIELQELGYVIGDEISQTNWFNEKTLEQVTLIEMRRGPEMELVAISIIPKKGDELRKIVIQRNSDGRWKDQFGEVYNSPAELITMEFRGYRQITSEI